MQIADETESFSNEDLALVADDNGAETVDAGKGGDVKPAAGADVGKVDASKPDAGDADKGKWFTDDWKEKAISGVPEPARKKAESYLKTRSSPYDILNGAMSADDKIRELTSTRVKIPTGKDDDPKEVAAYRKAIGIPDDPEKYKIDVPAEYGELSQLDKDLVSDFRKEAFKTGMPQSAVDLAIKTHFTIQKTVAAEEARKVLQASQKNQDELRVHFGKEFRQTVELTNRMFQTELAEAGLTDQGERHEFLSKRLSDGTMLGEYPPFVKMMAKIARERADDGAFIMGETTDGEDLDTKIDAIMKKRNQGAEGMKEYQRMEPEMKRLIAAQNRMKARGK